MVERAERARPRLPQIDACYDRGSSVRLNCRFLNYGAQLDRKIVGNRQNILHDFYCVPRPWDFHPVAVVFFSKSVFERGLDLPNCGTSDKKVVAPRHHSTRRFVGGTRAPLRGGLTPPASLAQLTKNATKHLKEAERRDL